MKLIGVTGSIGSGKSTVASLLAKKGAIVIDADKIARRVVEPGKPAWGKVVGRFGKEILNADQTINRRKLGKIVFENPKELESLNNIVHPPVIEEIDDIVDQVEKEFKDGKIVVIDAPLLIEVGLHKICDLTVVIKADKNIRLERIVSQGLSEEEAKSRINSQQNKGRLEGEADVVIQNNGTLEDLKKTINSFWKQIKS